MAAKKIRLSPNKAKWAGQFKPPILKGGKLPQPVAIEARYNAALQKLVKQMTKETRREVEKLFTSPVAVESHVTTAASIASQSRILMNALQSKFSKMFTDAARFLAESMVMQSAKASSVAVASSLKELSGGLTIKTDTLKSGPVNDILKASVAENVGLIKSIPGQYLDNVRGAVMRSITSGNGLQDLVPYLAQQEGVTERRAKNIALDQTRKAYQAMNNERMKAAGVTSFEWVHSFGGQKPRQHHVDMNGNIYRYDDPPVIDPKTGERGLPGQLPNCRCTTRPVLNFGDQD